MNRPSWRALIDADLWTCMLARTGPWLEEWLLSVTLEEAVLYRGGEKV